MQRIWTSNISVLLFLVLVLQDVPLNNAQQNPQYRPKDGRVKLNHQRNQHNNYQENFHSRNSYSIYTTTRSIQSTTVQRGDQRPTPDEDDEYSDTLAELYPKNYNIGSYNSNYPKGYVEYSPWFRHSSTLPSNIEPFYFRAYRPPLKVHPCEQSSCYPATGNLLIGREKRLTATSTCGVNGPQRFCIVSHLEEKKCFLCDTRDYTRNDALKNHRVGQIIYKTKPGTREYTWWQSENGVENVTIQLDLEAEFHFTHLIIVFATFRPSAMFIERSYDFGQTWNIYRYFAHNCRDTFPDIPLDSKNVSDVVCDQRYSGVEPSKNGEIIYRVLPPYIKIADPYANHIQNMLKMTNLRINFTKLHTLGDTLLDDRSEIQEKYYYAISSMVVRGSCSCYGHASRCLPLDGVENTYDMVHGRCECTHNTKGLNCEDCEDFYNDLPWKPAYGKQTNACRTCECNNHATSCHYDEAVFQHSGGISGGVCDNCQHNTQGQHCEACIPFFYHDPREDIQSPHACQPCDCDPRGSLDDGICDSVTDIENNIESGSCHCKGNVKGRRCDMCKDGFWNLQEKNTEGCQNCTCNTLGTINNLGCNMFTGECTCKRLVTGKDCNQCLSETYGLSDSRDGCSMCNCDPGGSYDNFCDVTDGHCRCRSHMTGRTCSIPKQNHFIPELTTIIETENPLYTECESYSNFGNCSVLIKEHPYGRPPEWTGPGFIRTYEGTTLTVSTDPIPQTLPYNIIIRHQTQTPGDWEHAIITIVRPDRYDPDGECANSHPSYENNVPFTLTEERTSSVILHDICLERGKTYKFRITFQSQKYHEENPIAQILIDSVVLVPRIEVTPLFKGSPAADDRRRQYIELGCNDTYYEINYEDNLRRECKDLINIAAIYVFDGATPCNCDITGSVTKKCEEFGGNCNCKPNVVGRQCDRCAPGTYGFGPEGCKSCDCDSIGAKDNDCDSMTGQCKCQPNTYGRECNQCQLGYWNFPNCQICDCNGHTKTCDSRTGECTNCQDFTTGYRCDRCIESFYGDPHIGSEIGCRACRCPNTVVSGHSYATECQLDSKTNDMICYCDEGYSGRRCDVCAENFFGHPEKPGGVCKPCLCNDNIDLNIGGNCDGHSGKCLQCMYDTDGFNCEYCKDGYWGDALIQHCQKCDCDVLGTNSTITHCDRYTGQCPCLKNVIGPRCDRCTPYHWKIASGEGCEPCDCDLKGSNNKQCNPYDGQCECNEGFGGRQCNECQANYWGNPTIECHHCECNLYGSASEQCDRKTGKCKCTAGMGGDKCDVCARGYYGEAPYCDPCGECFNNWDLILDSLQDETTKIINDAKKIKLVGATGAYTTEFDAMEKKLNVIQKLLENATVSPDEIDRISNYQTQLRKQLNASIENLQDADKQVDSLYTKINEASAGLDTLKSKSDTIQSMAADLKENATKLQEANVEGALNLTRAAWGRVTALEEENSKISMMVLDAERQIKRTDAIITRSHEDYNNQLQKNQITVMEYTNDILLLNSKIPDLNEQMCDGRGDPCDQLCGGAGCDTCGGFSCDKGALTKATKSLDFAKDNEANIKKKEEIADNLIRSLSQAKTNASDIFDSAELTHDKAERFYNHTRDLVKRGNEGVEKLVDALNNNTASPEEITEIAEQILGLDLKLDPEEIKILAKQIDDTVSSLKNVEEIISKTRNDLDEVEFLKMKANDTKRDAENVLETANTVVKALSETEEAQLKAMDAIKKANTDVELAKHDLGQIESETVLAQNNAHSTVIKVDELHMKLNKLHKSLLTNELDAKQIENKAENVKEEASKAYMTANNLRDSYKSTNHTLTERAKASEQARQRAQTLLQRASKITVDTNEKLKELQEMVGVYTSNEEQLKSIEHKIDELNNYMSSYLNHIQDSADRYRQCTS